MGLLIFLINIEGINKDAGYSKKKSTMLTESILEIMKMILESGEDILISGFGKFCVSEKEERRGRNPIGEMGFCALN